jgi:D-arabinose 1-dehydrogenase-like Zn-dependent alcohol dehydrogenase
MAARILAERAQEATVRALVLEQPGEQPKMAVREVPAPVPGPRQALVKVAACGVCYHDVLVMRGVLRRGVKPQVILGHEIAGEVVETGALVSTVFPGDKVVSILTDACGVCARCSRGQEHRCAAGVGIGHGADGGFAELVAIGETSLVKLPPEQDLAGACIMACPMGVVVNALVDRGGLAAGETAVITGAGGGVGVHAVQIARAVGARVLAVTTSPEKEERLRGLGADEVLLAPDLDFAELVQAYTGDEGADVVLNVLGAMAFEPCWRSLGQFGRMVILGDVRGGTVTLNPAELLFRDASLIGVSGVSRRQVATVAKLVQTGRVRPVVSQTHRLEEWARAYEAMVGKQSFGRVALVPG